MSRKKNLVQIIAACEKTEFDKIVKVYLQEVYGFHRIVQTDGKNDCGIDIKVFDNAGRKIQYQLTIQKSSTPQEKAQLKNKIFEDVAKAEENSKEYGWSNNLLYFYSYELTNKAQREYKQKALIEYGINLEFVDANQIAEESEEFFALQQVIYDTSGLADFKLKKSLYEDENKNLIYDLVSFGKTSDVKLEIVEAYILRCLYDNTNMSQDEIAKSCINKFQTNDNPAFYTKLINKLISKEKKIFYNKKIQSYELTPNTHDEISKQIEQIKIDEKLFINQIGAVLVEFHQEEYIDEYIELLNDMYIDNFSKRIEVQNIVENVSINKLMYYVKGKIDSEISQKQLVSDLVGVCERNKYLQKICASYIFSKKVNIDNLQKYARERKQVFIDTTIALHIICYFYKNSDYSRYNYVLSKSLCDYCKRNKIQLYLTNRYLWEIGTHIQEALNLIPFTTLPGFSLLGESRNVFYNHYCFLRDNGIIEGSFEEYLNDYEFRISNTQNTNCQLAENYLEKMGVTIIEIPKYDIQNEIKIIGNKLSETGRFKTTFALNNDAIMLKYLGDKDVDVHPIDSVFVTWDRTLFGVLNEFYKKNPNSARWMQFTPSQFIDRYSLLSFSINEETISKDILALISGNIIQHTTSLIDSLALIINPKDEVGLEYTKRFTQMKDSQIYMSNKNPDGEVEYTENNAIDNVIYRIIAHYRENKEKYDNFKGLFKSKELINDVIKIMEDAIQCYINNNNIGSDTITRLDNLINK